MAASRRLSNCQAAWRGRDAVQRLAWQSLNRLPSSLVSSNPTDSLKASRFWDFSDIVCSFAFMNLRVQPCPNVQLADDGPSRTLGLPLGGSGPPCGEAASCQASGLMRHSGRGVPTAPCLRQGWDGQSGNALLVSLRVERQYMRKDESDQPEETLQASRAGRIRRGGP